MFGDAPQAGEGAGRDGLGLRGEELFLVEKFGEVEHFADLVFWKRLDELIEFFGGCHSVSIGLKVISCMGHIPNSLALVEVPSWA